MRTLFITLLATLCLISLNITAEESVKPTAEPEVDRYTAPDEIARNKEIKELKCTICATRCKIVQDAGRSTCNSGPTGEACNKKADEFGTACLDQCTECR